MDTKKNILAEKIIATKNALKRRHLVKIWLSL